jgi:hypothetical protein
VQSACKADRHSMSRQRAVPAATREPATKADTRKLQQRAANGCCEQVRFLIFERKTV